MAASPPTHNQELCDIQDLKSMLSSVSNDQDYLTINRSFTIDDDDIHIQHPLMLKDVRVLLDRSKENTFKSLVILESLQRLGIDYHFQADMDWILKRAFMEFKNESYCLTEHRNLFEVSLCFRLLRQQGYYVSADVFKNFLGKGAKLEGELRSDIKGLMGLYEASELRVEGEYILEEAANVSSHLLNEMVTILDHDQARMVRNTLEHSYRKSSASFMIKNFIKEYDGTIMQKLAEMDFILVQAVHRRELHQISRWWTDLGLAKELKFARDQPVKWYIWPMAALTDPNMSQQRIELTKAISLIYVIDDIFDVYGTLKDLTEFTEVVNRWDIDAIEHLPDYMQICFKALHNITDETAYKIYKKHGFYPIDFLRKSWTTLCDAFLVEARWFSSEHLPAADEYLKNGIVSSGAHVVLVHMFFLLGDGKTAESASLVNDNRDIISSVATILRLWDDLGSAKDENQEGRDGSFLKCYMNEHPASSVQNAREHVVNMIGDTWKGLNKECLSPNQFSADFRKASLNLARMIPLMYDYDENHSLPLLKEYIKSMLGDG